MLRSGLVPTNGSFVTTVAVHRSEYLARVSVAGATHAGTANGGPRPQAEHGHEHDERKAFHDATVRTLGPGWN